MKFWFCGESTAAMLCFGIVHAQANAHGGVRKINGVALGWV